MLSLPVNDEDALKVADDDDTLKQVGVVGHELRNALTSVLAAAENINRRCGAETASEHEVIVRQVQRMRKLVDEMLLLARGE